MNTPKLLPLLVALSIMSASFGVRSDPIIGLYDSEVVSGQNKICYYNVLGEHQALNLPAYGTCPMTHYFEVVPKSSNPASPTPATTGERIGFLKGQHTQGQAKICYYDVLGNLEAVTVNSTSICPLTMKFR